MSSHIKADDFEFAPENTIAAILGPGEGSLYVGYDKHESSAEATVIIINGIQTFATEGAFVVWIEKDPV